MDEKVVGSLFQGFDFSRQSYKFVLTGDGKD
jgi:hypothetical protein